MEIGPTTHYMMGGVRVDGDTQMSNVPGLFAAGECARGTARRESPGRQFAVRPAGVRQARRRVRGEVREGKRRGHGRSRRRWTTRRGRRWSRSSATRRRESVSRSSTTAGHDAGPGGHRARAKTRWSRRWTRSRELKAARGEGRRCRAIANTTPAGTRRSICDNLLTVSEAITRCGDRAQGKPRRHFRDDYPDKERGWGEVQSARSTRAPDGGAASRARAGAADAGRAEAGDRGEEVMATATFRIWRGDGSRRQVRRLHDRSRRRHGGARRRAPDPGRRRPTIWPCAGTARRASAGRARRRSTASRRLMCMTRLNALPLDQPVTVEPMQTFPHDQGSGDRRVLELPRSRRRSRSSSRASRTRPTAPGACSRPTSTACRNSASASSASCARTSATCCAITTCTTSSSGRASWFTPPRWR